MSQIITYWRSLPVTSESSDSLEQRHLVGDKTSQTSRQFDGSKGILEEKF